MAGPGLPPINAPGGAPRAASESGELLAAAVRRATTSAATPGRLWLRLAGALSQLTAGVCLLIGTIGLVLVQQNKTGQIGWVLAWLVLAMVGLVLGGLVYRGGALRLAAAAVIDGGLGVVLVTFDGESLHRLLKILPASDVDTIAIGLGVAGGVMMFAGLLCVAAVPQGIRFARWLRTASEPRTAMSTARGFPPPPVPAGAAYAVPGDDAGSRRRLYLVLGGVAIAVGAGIGVLVSELRPARPTTTAAAAGSARVGAGSGASRGAAGSAAVAAGSGSGSAVVAAGSAAPPAVPPVLLPPPPAGEPATVAALLLAEHAAIGKADGKALAALRIADAFGFGIDADETADRRDAVVAQILRDLGDPPADGFTVVARNAAVGEERGHAWIAEELELGGADREPRHIAVSALAAVVGGKWQFVAQHWAVPVADATAERLAILKTLSTPQPIADRHDGAGASELDRAIRAAFDSKAAFADARSERPDAFNYGSGGERAHGGVTIKKIFNRIKAQIRLHDGARVVAGSQWDPTQQAAPWIGWAAVNVDFTAKTRAATDVTQTFRVLVIAIKDGGAWQLVQTQWSNGGPIR